MSSLILRFPPNFVRQLSNKARRNCSNIGVAQIVAASWSNNQPLSSAAGAKAVDAAASSAVSAPFIAGEDAVDNNDKELGSSNGSPLVQSEALESVHKPSFLKGDGSVGVHAGMLLNLSLSRHTDIVEY